jgi:hypothetical protein
MKNNRIIDRKGMINEYKQTLQPMGIYQIRNLSNGKVLIESSKNLNGSLNSGKFQLDVGSHRNRALQEDYSKFGEDQFSFEILDRLEPKKDDPAYNCTDDLETLKAMWLDKLKPFGDKGYNSIPKAR